MRLKRYNHIGHILMEIIDRHIHEGCFYYNKSEQPIVELISVVKGGNGNLPIRKNEIVFFLEGGLRFIFSDELEYRGLKGAMLFLPAGCRFYYEALEKTTILVLRIDKPILVCEDLSLENLYRHTHTRKEKQYDTTLKALPINARIWHFLEGVANSLADGVKCRKYFNLVLNEFFFLFRFYYSQDEIYGFLFYLTLSKDIIFAEHIRRQWYLFRSVEEIAQSMWMSPRKFSVKFREVFGQTPYRWMKENRAKLIYKELTTTDKMIKQIAFEQGFDNKSQFTKFCKKELGASPSEIRADKSS